MPLMVHPPIRRADPGLALSAALLAFAALPAFATAAAPVALTGTDRCVDGATAPIFQNYGDAADYAIVPGGDFEADDGTGAGWALQGAKPQSAGALRPTDVKHEMRTPRDPKSQEVLDSRSLKMKRKGAAISPSICVSARHPTFRFFAFKPGGEVGNLDVSLRWTDGLGYSHEELVGSLDGSSFATWGIGPVLPLAERLNLTGSDSAQVNLVFDFAKVRNGVKAQGEWLIDEVYVDPYRR